MLIRVSGELSLFQNIEQIYRHFKAELFNRTLPEVCPTHKANFNETAFSCLNKPTSP